MTLVVPPSGVWRSPEARPEAGMEAEIHSTASTPTPPMPGSNSRGLDTSEAGGHNLFHKAVFVMGNLVNVALAMYKCHSMGMLPTYASDWLAFADPVERVEWAYT